MVMPALSVTMIGLVGAAVGALSGRWPLGSALGRGIVGAWVGFGVGAVIGIVIDVAFGEGVFVAIVGHGAAIIGAVGALRPAEERRLPGIRPR